METIFVITHFIMVVCYISILYVSFGSKQPDERYMVVNNSSIPSKFIDNHIALRNILIVLCISLTYVVGKDYKRSQNIPKSKFEKKVPNETIDHITANNNKRF